MNASAWCPVCRTRRPIVETDTTDSGDRYADRRTYVLVRLDCGHTNETETSERDA